MLENQYRMTLSSKTLQLMLADVNVHTVNGG